VGYSGARRAEFPVAKNGKVVDFQAWVTASRKEFPVDMAAFAVSVRYFLGHKPVFFEPLAPSSTGEVSRPASWPAIPTGSSECPTCLLGAADVRHVSQYPAPPGFGLTVPFPGSL